jgi:hypothetical protein
MTKDEKSLTLVCNAIHELVELEGSSVFPNGLPTELSKALIRLREERSKLQENIAGQKKGTSK